MLVNKNISDFYNIFNKMQKNFPLCKICLFFCNWQREHDFTKKLLYDRKNLTANDKVYKKIYKRFIDQYHLSSLYKS